MVGHGARPEHVLPRCARRRPRLGRPRRHVPGAGRVRSVPRAGPGRGPAPGRGRAAAPDREDGGADRRAVPARAPRGGGWKGAWRRCEAVFTDSATWRDVLWAQCAVTVTGLLAIVPFAMLAHGLFGMALPFIWEPVTGAWDGTWYLFVPVRGQESAWIAAGLGLAEIPVGLLIAPYVLRLHARITRSLLAPTAKAEMGSRVAHLARTRTDAVDSSAAEIRRIERDLHDGAQARLLAMGMKLGAAESLLDENPEAVRTLLAETRDASMRALEELRDLVRGIHPRCSPTAASWTPSARSPWRAASRSR
ncbi:histidine kinase [Streptomyces sp. Ac-502]|uniref:sensor histidine kinase n=1 Tax=Streptomyces sp. Ac-502 TaxID=3342801 RepID=UPI003862BC34